MEEQTVQLVIEALKQILYVESIPNYEQARYAIEYNKAISMARAVLKEILKDER